MKPTKAKIKIVYITSDGINFDDETNAKEHQIAQDKDEIYTALKDEALFGSEPSDIVDTIFSLIDRGYLQVTE